GATSVQPPAGPSSRAPRCVIYSVPQHVLRDRLLCLRTQKLPLTTRPWCNGPSTGETTSDVGDLFLRGYQSTKAYVAVPMRPTPKKAHPVTAREMSVL